MIMRGRSYSDIVPLSGGGGDEDITLRLCGTLTAWTNTKINDSLIRHQFRVKMAIAQSCTAAARNPLPLQGPLLLRGALRHNRKIRLIRDATG